MTYFTRNHLVSFTLILLGQLVFASESIPSKNKPNVILILADDLGYGDLSCYGQKNYQTPNIDALATNGIRFTQHYAGAPVCAPSRCALLTGKNLGHATIRGNKKANKYGDFPIAASDTTLAQLFKNEGYTTGMFGKWGLGVPNSTGDIQKKGFDTFFGYYGQLAAHDYYPEFLWRNNQQVPIPENKKYKNKVYAPMMLHDSVLQFLDKNKSNPFFLFIPTIIPHAELVPPDSLLVKNIGKYGHEKPYKGIKTIKFARRFGAYGVQKNPKSAFAAMMELLDKQVGEIVAKLKADGIFENTIILFTSDNGPHHEGGANPAYFNSNGGLRGSKRDLYEGGIRVPLIIHWPNHLQPESSDLISANWDIMPTLATFINAKIPSNIDGISLLPTTANQTITQHPYLYWEFHEQGGKQAIRMGKWKGVQLKVKHPRQTRFQLFNLDEDPTENNDVSQQFPDVVQQIKQFMDTAHTPSPLFPFKKIDKQKK